MASARPRELEDSYEVVLQGFGGSASVTISQLTAPNQLVEQIEIARERWVKVRQQLAEQGDRLEKLRNSIAASTRADNQPIVRDVERTVVPREIERARHQAQISDLQRRHAVAVEKERASFLDRFEQLNQLQKKLISQDEGRKRVSDTALEELAKLTVEIEQEREAAQQARDRARELELELDQANAGREQAEKEKAELERTLEELKTTISNETTDPAEQHQQQQQQKPQAIEGRQGPEHDKDREIQQLKQEIGQLKQSEKELSDRCSECNRIVNEVIAESEKVKYQLMTERNRLLADQKEAISDYADKMKEKARAELRLRDQIRDLTKQLDEMKRHSAPERSRKY
uniref:Chromosome partition protein Smc n=1 Tax=Macrostomum lignano TaxID=282301 RepID=A0A1I8GA87_9PLAT